MVQSHIIASVETLDFVATMSPVKMKLTFEAMQTLMEELRQNEMWVIYLMGLGKEMTEKVTKTDLNNIIRILCKNLKWIGKCSNKTSKF